MLPLVCCGTGVAISCSPSSASTWDSPFPFPRLALFDTAGNTSPACPWDRSLVSPCDPPGGHSSCLA